MQGKRTRDKRQIAELIKRQKLSNKEETELPTVPEVLEDQTTFQFHQVLVDSSLWAKYLAKDIEKQLYSLSKKYNRTERVKVKLCPFPSSLFDELFAPFLEQMIEKNLNHRILRTIKLKPKQLSYLLGNDWWYVVSLIDSKSRAVNGLFQCDDNDVKLQYCSEDNEFLLSFGCELVNMYGVVQ